MSTREQHEIIGKTVLEHGEAKRKVAVLEAKARSYAAYIRAIARELYPISERHTSESVESLLATSAGNAIENYPNRADVVELLTELRETRAKVEELAQSLHEMGARP